MPRISFTIRLYNKRPPWQRRYEVHMVAQGYITIPDTTWLCSFWTVKGARRFADRMANKYDFKTIEATTMEHTEDE